MFGEERVNECRWNKFLANEVPSYELRNNFNMSKGMFYELRDLLRPWLQ